MTTSVGEYDVRIAASIREMSASWIAIAWAVRAVPKKARSQSAGQATNEIMFTAPTVTINPNLYLGLFRLATTTAVNTNFAGR